MFEDLESRLRNIDTAFNEAVYQFWLQDDLNHGFDLSKRYTKEELKRGFFSSLEALKQNGENSKYILIELELQDGKNSFSDFYLSGFEYFSLSHLSLTSDFLSELKPIFTGLYEIPSHWPEEGAPGNKRPLREVKFSSGDLRLSVNVLGGGYFRIQEKEIVFSGSSKGFGSISQHEQKLKQLLDKLIQNPIYQSYTYRFI